MVFKTAPLLEVQRHSASRSHICMHTISKLSLAECLMQCMI